MGKLLLGKEKGDSGDAETLSFGQANIVQELCTYAEAVKQQIICANHPKILMVV